MRSQLYGPEVTDACHRPGLAGRGSVAGFLACAIAQDEATLRSVIREILPNVMLDVAMKPPG